MTVASPLFTDITRQAGIDFTHRQGRRILYLPQTMGPGCALFDYDGDGWLDALVVQGSGEERPGANAPAGTATTVATSAASTVVASAATPAASASAATPGSAASAAAPPGGAVLWRNRGDGTFEDVTARAGLDARGWGMGVLAADLANSGWPDLVLTYYGQPPVLWHNQGDGTFRRVEHAFPPTSFGAHPWSTGLAALDTEHRGLLDLYICGYTDFGPERFVDPVPSAPLRGSMQPVTLSPYIPAPLGSVLLRNQGGLSFADVTAHAGVANRRGKALAAVAFDADDDTWPDLFVADDVTPGALFQNHGDGTFKDVAADAWVSQVAGSMGLAVCDYNHDGALDFFCTHWVDEVHALYHSTVAARSRAHAKASSAHSAQPVSTQHPCPALATPMPAGGAMGAPVFVERGQTAGLGDLPLDLVGWGAAFADVDQDGWEDLVFVCGHTFVDPSTLRTIAQEGVAMRNTGRATFTRWPAAAAGALATARTARGAAFGDIDRDGALDILIAQCGGPASLLAGRRQAHWLTIQLVGTRSNRDAADTRLALEAGGETQTRELVTGDSYLSSNPREIHFGLGHATHARLSVRWPTGRVQVAEDLAADRVVRVVEAPSP